MDEILNLKITFHESWRREQEIPLGAVSLEDNRNRRLGHQIEKRQSDEENNQILRESCKSGVGNLVKCCCLSCSRSWEDSLMFLANELLLPSAKPHSSSYEFFRICYLIAPDDGLHSQVIVNQFVIDATSCERWPTTADCRKWRPHVLRCRNVISRHWCKWRGSRIGIVTEISVPRLQKQRENRLQYAWSFNHNNR